MKTKLEAFRHKLERYWKHIIVTGHLSYFGTVALEAHGYYGVLAGIMAFLVAMGAIFHLDDGGH
jgi:hypothetical protein